MTYYAPVPVRLLANPSDAWEPILNLGGGGDGETLPPLVTKLLTFMTQRFTNEAGQTVPAAFVRMIEDRRRPNEEVPYVSVVERYLDCSPITKCVHFLSLVIIHYPTAGRSFLQELTGWANALLELQVKDPSSLRFGGFRTNANDMSCSAYNAGHSGLAMYYAYLATGNTAYRQAAINAAEYLMVLHDPNAFYHPKYGVTIISDMNAWSGFADSILSGDIIRRAQSMWNSQGIQLLMKMGTVLNKPEYIAAAQNSADWYEQAVWDNNFPEVYSAIGPAHAYVTASPQLESDLAYEDNMWHRRGETTMRTPPWDVTSFPVNSQGTDQYETLLPALVAAGFNINSLYEEIVSWPWAYEDAATSASVAVAPGYNPRTCWGGYFRCNTGFYSNAPGMPPGTDNVHYGANYDTQGVSALLSWKFLNKPADYQLALALANRSLSASTLTKNNYEARWGIQRDANNNIIWEFTRRGVGNVLGSIGVGVMESIEAGAPETDFIGYEV